MRNATESVPSSASVALPEYRADWAFFLDIDGTLIEIAETPGTVRVDAELLGLLQRLHATAGGALALVSGRSLVSIDTLFQMSRLPAAGQHGAERRDAQGKVHLHAAGPARMQTAA